MACDCRVDSAAHGDLVSVTGGHIRGPDGNPLSGGRVHLGVDEEAEAWRMSGG